MRLFLNPGNSAYLRGLADDFGESTNAVRLELNKFEEAGLLIAETQGNKKYYQANRQHPLFKDINNIVIKYVGLDRIIDIIIGRLGNLEKLLLVGDYAEGKDTGILDLIVVGDIDKQYLVNLIEKSEKLIGKKLRYIHYRSEDWTQHKKNSNTKGLGELLLWQKNSK
jgi:DNA-binding transcriptional ArsR family regulator